MAATHAEQNWVASDAQAASEGIHGTVQRALFDEHDPHPRIAVLEDDASLARQFVNHFNALGYEATPYPTVQALQAAVPAQHFVAYVMDWVVGNETVAGLVEVLQARESTSPIIVVTGKLGSDKRVEPEIIAARKHRRLEFFQKPVSLRFISGTLARELGARAPGAAMVVLSGSVEFRAGESVRAQPSLRSS